MYDPAQNKCRHAVRRTAPALLIAVLAMLLAAGCASSPKKQTKESSAPSTKASSSAASSASSSADANAQIVHVTSMESDGATYGIGMPIVLWFDPVPTDITAFNKAVKVTVNGAPAQGAWYWEKPYADKPVEAHYRLQNYWPAHSTIKVDLPIGGLSAGKGLKFSDALTSLTFGIGDAHISTVNAANEASGLTVTSNGQVVKVFPVSLGKATTPTTNGIKVVMQKGEDIPGTNTLRPNGTVMMSGPGYQNDPVPWSVRVTRDGEYIHAAGWNTNIGIRPTSNGCTNLKPADAQWFYAFSMLGDVVQYGGTPGQRVTYDDGLGDWNVNWSEWLQGGPDLPGS